MAVVNKEMTRKFQALVDGAEEFLKYMPWEPIFEKDTFLRPDFTSLEVRLTLTLTLTLTGALVVALVWIVHALCASHSPTVCGCDYACDLGGGLRLLGDPCRDQYPQLRHHPPERRLQERVPRERPLREAPNPDAVNPALNEPPTNHPRLVDEGK